MHGRVGPAMPFLLVFPVCCLLNVRTALQRSLAKIHILYILFGV